MHRSFKKMISGSFGNFCLSLKYHSFGVNFSWSYLDSCVQEEPVAKATDGETQGLAVSFWGIQILCRHLLHLDILNVLLTVNLHPIEMHPFQLDSL